MRHGCGCSAWANASPSISRSRSTMSGSPRQPESCPSRLAGCEIDQFLVVDGRIMQSRDCAPYDRSLWQRGFQDRIIRNDYMLDTLRTYIERNTGRWTGKLD